MAAIKNTECETCQRNYVKNLRGPRPEPSSARVKCPGCDEPFHLCRLHRPVFVTCGKKECEEKWPAEAAKGVPKERLSAPANAKTRKPKGFAQFQGELI